MFFQEKSVSLQIVPSVPDLHPWNLSPSDAIALQKSLRDRLTLRTPSCRLQTVAGADISFNKDDPTVYAGIVVLRLPDLAVVEEATVVTEATFPYVPGLLSFREAPAILAVWEKLRTKPDATMFDGQGVAHPRRFGIAAHVGLWLDRPTWGCAKSLLCGRYDEPGPARGARSPLVDKGETVGAVLRTKDHTSPVFVSAGNHMDLETAVDLTLRCGGGYRVPEPTRRAHLLVNALRRGEGQSSQDTEPSLL